MSSTSQTLQPEDLLEHLEWMHRLARALTYGDVAEAEDLAEDAMQPSWSAVDFLAESRATWRACDQAIDQLVTKR
jgi:DNA-directed RNA polymerase specialized sigma24 family protein